MLLDKRDAMRSYEGISKQAEKLAFHKVHNLYVIVIICSFYSSSWTVVFKAPWGIWFMLAWMAHIGQCGLSRHPSMPGKGC